MVNQKRLFNKLPELLIDGPTTIRQNYNDYFSYRYRLQQLKRKKPNVAAKALQDLTNFLDELERAMQVEV